MVLEEKKANELAEEIQGLGFLEDFEKPQN